MRGALPVVTALAGAALASCSLVSDLDGLSATGSTGTQAGTTATAAAASGAGAGGAGGGAASSAGGAVTGTSSSAGAGGATSSAASTGSGGGGGSAPCIGADEFADPATGHCYRLFLTRSLDWAPARDACLALGGGYDLATVSTPAEYALLSSKLVPLGTYTVWAGGTDSDTEGTFVWASGEPWTADVPWATGEPNNFDSGDGVGQDCTELASDHDDGINDATCSNAREFLCERP